MLLGIRYEEVRNQYRYKQVGSCEFAAIGTKGFVRNSQEGIRYSFQYNVYILYTPSSKSSRNLFRKILIPVNLQNKIKNYY